jgi:5-methylcytosine-specific restriction endonuclease McrA
MEQLEAEPFCASCGAPATVADHRIPRRELAAAGVADPHAREWLQSLCATCHNRKTGRGQ